MEKDRIKYLIDSGNYELAKMINHCLHTKSDYIDFKSHKILLSYKKALEYSINLFDFNDKDYLDSLKIIHADNQRYNRLLKRIVKYLDMGSCLFFTLTFTDDVLNNTNEETRRKYVRRFLKSISSCYVANVDYGEKNCREHYHGVILSDMDSFKDKWSYGFSNAQIIIDDNHSSDRIAKYVLKVCNHFIKSTTNNNRVIYSYYRDKWTYEITDPFMKCYIQNKIRSFRSCYKRVIYEPKYIQTSLLYTFDEIIY